VGIVASCNEAMYGGNADISRIRARGSSFLLSPLAAQLDNLAVAGFANVCAYDPLLGRQLAWHFVEGEACFSVEVRSRTVNGGVV
jgi:hypothetical protein